MKVNVMEKKRNEKVITEFKKRFQKQFNCELDERLFLFVVNKELSKKKESYLQLLLSSKGLGFADLLALKKTLQSKNQAEKANDFEQESSESEVIKELKKPKRGRAPKAEPEFEVDKDELDKEKRRMYARTYYLRKKEKALGGKPMPAKKFKTSSEQRAYQRSYYQRKKKLIQKSLNKAVLSNSELNVSESHPALNLKVTPENHPEMNVRSLFSVKTKLRKAKVAKQD